MDHHNKHIEQNKFFSKVEIPYSETKDDVWNKLSEKIKVKEEGKVVELKKRDFKYVWYSAAAVVILLIGITAFMRFYAIELNAPNGQHLAAELPDGSTIHLNAQTTLTYKPYWWRFSRELKLDGEAYFEVEKGKKFRVISDYGTTQVLGTSFNIFARMNKYEVHCFTGKVKVTSKKGDNRILEPEQSVLILKGKIEKIKKKENIDETVAWIDNNFFFTAVPLIEVFKELERQFDVKIEMSYDIRQLYTGNFKRGSSVEEILDNICKSMGIDYTKTSTNKYIILKR